VIFSVVTTLAVTGAARAAPLVDDRERLGDSVEGRAVHLVHRGDPDARTVLVVGCIHGDECAGARIVHLLDRGDPRRALDLWLVPTMNPDGRAAGTRQNARGVDLNRNFPYRWRSGPRDRFYPGRRPASELETRIAMTLVERIDPEVTIWFHQPLGLVDRSGGSVLIQRRYARLVGLPLVTLDPLHGTATTWQNHRDPDSTAFVVELPAGRLRPRDARRYARAVFEALAPRR
jgi:protein MpaA